MRFQVVSSALWNLPSDLLGIELLLSKGSL